MDNELQYNYVLSTEEMSKFKKMNRVERQMYHYNGPEFNTLDERVQTALQEYLNDLGINEHLASFIEVMAIDKDQRIYINWLKSIKELST